MIPATKDFVASNNTPWLADIALFEADGTPLDLTVYDSFVMHVKTDAFDPEEQVAPTITSPVAGTLRIAAPVADIETLWGVYVYDLIGLDGSGDPVDRIMVGTIDVNQGVTVI